MSENGERACVCVCLRMERERVCACVRGERKRVCVHVSENGEGEKVLNE